MPEIFKYYLQHFPWTNFTNYILYLRWSIALLELFSFLILCILMSNLAFRRDKPHFTSSLEEFVFRSALGMSLISFTLSFLGLLGALKPIYFLLILAIALLFMLFSGISSYYATFHLLKAILFRYKYLWGLFFISSLPSLLPPLQYDETMYHLPYIMKWVNEGNIFVDPDMRYPLYTFNFHILFSIGFFVKSIDFIHLLSWLAGVLTTLSIISMLERFSTLKPLTVIAGLAFFFTPVVQQYLNVAYIDVPLMFFMFISTYSLVLLKDAELKNAFIIPAAIISAMFIGIKPTGILMAPLIYLVVLYKESFRRILPFIIVFSLLGSLWYLRNTIIDGDPIPPAVNMLLKRADLYWSVNDYKYIMYDLSVSHDWGWDIWYKLPLELLNSDGKGPLRYWPLLGYVILFPLSLFYLLVIKRDIQIMVVLCIVICSVVIWFLTSYFTRYAHYIPLAIVCSTTMLNDFAKTIKGKGKLITYSVITLFVFLMIGPKTSALAYYIKNFGKHIPLTKHDIFTSIGSMGGDPELFNLIWNLKKYGVTKGDRIYCYMIRQSQYRYYFEKEGYSILGDAIGRYGIGNFDKSLKIGKLGHFLQEANVQYLLIDRNGQRNMNEHRNGNMVPEIVYNSERYILLSLKHEY